MYKDEPSAEEWDEILTEDKEHDYNMYPISFPQQSAVEPEYSTNSPEGYEGGASDGELEHNVNPQTYQFEGL